MLKHIQNQRGGALIYVLMIFMVITITTPLIILSDSSTPIQNQKTVAHRQANVFSLSALESFVSYLKAYNYYATPYVSPNSYLAAYPTTPYSFVNPENQRVTVTIERIAVGTNLLVNFTATVVGGGVNETVVHGYKFNSSTLPPTPAPTTTTASSATPTPAPTPVPTPFIDTSYRSTVSSTQDKIYAQGSTNGTATAISTLQTNLSTAIANAIASITTNVNNTISQLDTTINNQIITVFPTIAPTPPPTSFNCTTCANVADITTAMTNHPTIPVYISNNISENANQSTATWGSINSSVSLYLKDLTFNNGGNLTIYGNVNFNTLTLNGASSLTVYGNVTFNNLVFNGSGFLNVLGNVAIKNSFAFYAGNSNSIRARNLYVFNNLTLYVKTTIDEMLYVKGDLVVTGNIPVTVGKSLYTTGSMTTNNGGTIKVTESLAVVGSMIFNGGTTIKAHDVYTKNSLTVNDGGNYNVTGTLYTGANSTTFNGNPTIATNDFVTNNPLTVNSGINLTVNKDMLVQSATLNGTNNFNIPNGDLLIQNNVTMNSGIKLIAGGNVAIGGNFTSWGTINYDLGGQTSSLHLNGATPTPAPTPTPTPIPTATPVGWTPTPTPSFSPFPWSPERKS